MAGKTTNLQLQKIDDTDYAGNFPAIYNNNLDLIDGLKRKNREIYTGTLSSLFIIENNRITLPNSFQIDYMIAIPNTRSVQLSSSIVEPFTFVSTETIWIIYFAYSSLTSTCRIEYDVKNGLFNIYISGKQINGNDINNYQLTSEIIESSAGNATEYSFILRV